MGSNKNPPPKPAKPAPAKAKAKAKAKSVPTKPESAPLVVEVDGKPLAPAESEETWRAFSAHMDEHQGDLAGFAKLRGWKSVAPTYRRGSAVLLVTTI